MTHDFNQEEGPISIEQVVERQKRITSFIEFVHVQKRDNCLIELGR